MTKTTLKKICDYPPQYLETLRTCYQREIQSIEKAKALSSTLGLASKILLRSSRAGLKLINIAIKQRTNE